MRNESVSTDKRAISPVIAVILAIAIGVMLAGVMGVYSVRLGGDLSDSSPNAQTTIEEDSAQQTILIRHDGGDTFDASTGSYTVKGAGASVVSWNDDSSTTDSSYTPTSPITDGDPIVTVDVSGATGETIRLVWEAPEGDDTKIIASYEVPNNGL